MVSRAWSGGRGGERVRRGDRRRGETTPPRKDDQETAKINRSHRSSGSLEKDGRKRPLAGIIAALPRREMGSSPTGVTVRPRGGRAAGPSPREGRVGSGGRPEGGCQIGTTCRGIGKNPLSALTRWAKGVETCPGPERYRPAGHGDRGRLRGATPPARLPGIAERGMGVLEKDNPMRRRPTVPVACQRMSFTARDFSTPFAVHSSKAPFHLPNLSDQPSGATEPLREGQNP